MFFKSLILKKIENDLTLSHSIAEGALPFRQFLLHSFPKERVGFEM